MNASTPSPATDLLRLLAQIAPHGHIVLLGVSAGTPRLRALHLAEPFRDEYLQNSYALRDPVVSWGLSRTGRARWPDGQIDESAAMIAAARQAGFDHGLGLAVGPTQCRSILNLMWTGSMASEPDLRRVETVLREAHGAIACENPVLTRAQREALACLSRGMRLARAAHHLGISESAMKARIGSARRRLGARNATEAVCLAVRAGLI